MIEVIASLLLTPAAIATPPPNVPAVVQTYDWKTQCSAGFEANGPSGSVRGSQSFVGSPPVLWIDDFNAD